MTHYTRFNKTTSFYISLFVAFIDYMGVGFIYPLFAVMLFDHTLNLLPLNTMAEMRGLLLGILIACMPLSQFFSAPIWGVISDNRGRKAPLMLSLGIGIIGYLLAFLGVILTNIWLLFLSRLIIGVASGNTSIVQATIVDLSSKEEKARNFGLYSMALGAGFTLGPFLGGILSSFGYHIPFLFACILMLVNFLFSMFYFKETHHTLISIDEKKKLNWCIGIHHLRKAFVLKGLRTILLCSFLHNFGWSYFFEFIPVYLISEFQFSSLTLGIFYGLAGCFYAFSTGLFIQPLVKLFQPETLFFAGNLLTAIVILTIPFLPTSSWIWPQLFLICYFVAFVTPSSTTIVSNHTDSKNQGEALGVLSSVNAAALIFSPLFSGSIVGKFPEISVIIGGVTLGFVALLTALKFEGVYDVK